MPNLSAHITRATVIQRTVIDHEPDPNLLALAIQTPLADRIAGGDVLIWHGSEGWCLSNDGRAPSALRPWLETIRTDMGLAADAEFYLLIRCG